MPQSILTTSNPSSLKNNLQSLYELLSSCFLLSVQLQSQIWISYIEISSQLFLVTQLLQNISLQIASGLQIQMVFSFLTTEFMYHPIVISVYASSSIIMITFLLDIMIKTKYWNQFAMDIPGPAPILIYNKSVGLVLLVYDLSHNITSPMDLSQNSLSLNDYGIPFL